MTKSAAYNRGSAAYLSWEKLLREGRIINTPACPYKRGTQEYEDWHEGYNDTAEAKWQG